MTPETLRQSVTAALARPSAQSPSSVLPVETVTMNGFSIVDSHADDWRVSEERRFTVVSPTGSRHEVLVQIDDELLEYVERLARRRLPFESSFWTEEARRLLANYLWTKSEAPRTRKLILNRLDRDAILVAERWQD
jgi:hypothetical protein